MKEKGSAVFAVAVGIVGMCITVLLMELWETLFAACGKVPFTFPCAVNGVFHDGIGSYAHFHDAKVFSLCLFLLCFHILRQVCRVNLVVVKNLVRLDNGGAAS